MVERALIFMCPIDSPQDKITLNFFTAKTNVNYFSSCVNSRLALMSLYKLKLLLNATLQQELEKIKITLSNSFFCDKFKK